MKKRQNAVGTTVYDIVTYSTGGAYYANSEYAQWPWRGETLMNE